MDAWELDFEWLRVRHTIKDRFKQSALPDLKAILFLIGIQELGQIKDSFSKEEKQDLMHIAVCALLEGDGFYKYKGRDEDGWPHYEVLKPFQVTGAEKQEEILKTKVIEYFEHHNMESEEE